MGSFLRPVGPQPPAVYWRRRILLLGIPLVLIAFVAYACSGSGGGGGKGGAAASPSSTSAIITPGAVPTGSLPPINSYPVTGPTGSGTPAAGGAAGGGSGGNGGSVGGAGGNGGASGGSVAGVPVGSTGCVLSVQVQLDKTSASGPPTYAAGQNPIFDVVLHNAGNGNCLVDVSPTGLVFTVTSVDDGSTATAWTSATCAPANVQDRRVLGPGDSYTSQTTWTRVEPGTKCQTTHPAGSGAFAVNATVSGVSSASAQFTLQ